MRSLFRCWNDFARRCNGKTLVLFLDFDGTLAPIASTPAKARLPVPVKKRLIGLSRLPDIRIAIISGRSLASLHRKVGVPHLVYAGNHGYEICGDRFLFTPSLDKKTLSILRVVRQDIAARLVSVPGILIEDKGFTIAIHYRRVSLKNVKRFKKIFSKAILPYRRAGDIKVMAGKQVFEIQPPRAWNKGKTVSWLLKNRPWLNTDKEILPCFIGDDTTDEDAFKTLRRKGITVIVGKKGNSHARYYLDQCNDVSLFLKRVWEYYSFCRDNTGYARAALPEGRGCIRGGGQSRR